MIAWVMTNWMTQLAAVVFACWLARGVVVALWRPRLTYSSHSRVEKKKGDFLTVKRQQLLPPWLQVQEVWWVPDSRREFCCVRESDGYHAPDKSELELQLHGLMQMANTRSAETEELSK